MLVPVRDEALDFASQVSDGIEGAAADGFVGDVPEPALDLVEPRGVRGCVMNVEARTAREPGFDLGMFVRAVVVNY